MCSVSYLVQNDFYFLLDKMSETNTCYAVKAAVEITLCKKDTYMYMYYYKL